MSTEANTFLENNDMINIIFNYIFGLAFQCSFSESLAINLLLCLFSPAVETKSKNHFFRKLVAC